MMMYTETTTPTMQQQPPLQYRPPAMTMTARRRRRKRPSVRLLLGVVLAFAAVLTTATDSFTPSQTSSSLPSRRRMNHGPLHASTVIPLPLHTAPSSHSTTTSTTNRRSQKNNHKDSPLLASSATSTTTTSTTATATGTGTTAATDVWAERYCSVTGLREAFGRNRNVLWGDLDGNTTRRLYKRLLPVILLELRDSGKYDAIQLAPLAYRARLAAKLYARERSIVPARISANLVDWYRHLIKYGEFGGTTGMSYQQLFAKYAELCQTSDEQQVCSKILERSCVSNEYIDRLCGIDGRQCINKAKNERRIQLWRELEDVAIQCEEDIKKLLQLSESLQNFRALRSIATVKRRINALQKGLSYRRQRPTTIIDNNHNNKHKTTPLV